MFSNENEHVGIEFPIKATKQGRNDTMHSTFTPSLHLVPFFPTTKAKQPLSYWLSNNIEALTFSFLTITWTVTSIFNSATINHSI